MGAFMHVAVSYFFVSVRHAEERRKKERQRERNE